MTKRLAPLALLLLLAMLPGTAALAGTGTWSLSVAKSGSGGGTVASDVQPGISCGATCSYDFASGATVTLTATPAAGSTFMGWSGACTGSGTCQVTMDASHSVGARFDRSYRPDAWIKLCGQSTGCTIDPPPHPWRGRNVYNGNGKRQTISQAIDNGEGVRFWITTQNDGASADTISVQGCKGNRYFPVNKVLMGEQKAPHYGVANVTKEFVNGTLSFNFGSSSQNQPKVFTLNVITSPKAVGVKYRCPITVTSQGDPSLSDTVIAVMSGF
ncbi:MAG: InlB B-repeat-containing protein [Actinomycetota bacterium]